MSLIMRAFSEAQLHDSHQSVPDIISVGKPSTAYLQKELEVGVRAGPAERSAPVALVEGAIAVTLANMLYVDLEDFDLAKSIADYGVNSPVCTLSFFPEHDVISIIPILKLTFSWIAAELRSWSLNALKTNISMLKLLDQSVSISALAAKIVDGALAEAGKYLQSTESGSINKSTSERIFICSPRTRSSLLLSSLIEASLYMVSAERLSKQVCFYQLT